MNEFYRTLKPFQRRIRIVQSWYGAAMGGAVGVLVCLIWSILDYFNIALTEWLWMGITVAACAIIGALVGFFKPVRLDAVGDSIDRRAGLLNRLGTALVFGESEGEFEDALRSDALQSTAKVAPKKVFPIRYYRWHTTILVVGALASLVFVLGNVPLLMSQEERADREELKKTVPAVERIAKPVLDQESGATQEERDLARELEKYARELKRGRLSKEQALEKANELIEKADKLAEESQAKADKTLGEADTALDKLMKEKLEKNGLAGADLEKATKSPDELAKMEQAAQSKVDSIQQKLKDGQPKSKEESEKLKSELEQAKSELNQIKLSKKAQETLAKLMQMKEWKELQEMARQLAGKNPQGKNQGKNQGQNGKLTKEQLKEMQQKLEELAKKLQDEKAMRDYIQKLKEAMKKKEGG